MTTIPPCSWHAGQSVLIEGLYGNRGATAVTRVTPSGRAIIEDEHTRREFNADGSERGGRHRLVALTAEIQADIDLQNRADRVFEKLHSAIGRASEFYRNSKPGMLAVRRSDVADVDLAERITKSILDNFPG